ncbi:MAG: hypothetical protein R3C99_07685 [Pirellulaceae bacterium]
MSVRISQGQKSGKKETQESQGRERRNAMRAARRDPSGDTRLDGMLGSEADGRGLCC